jgi:hypothetical protein
MATEYHKVRAKIECHANDWLNNWVAMAPGNIYIVRTDNLDFFETKPDAFDILNPVTEIATIDQVQAMIAAALAGIGGVIQVLGGFLAFDTDFSTSDAAVTSTSTGGFLSFLTDFDTADVTNTVSTGFLSFLTDFETAESTTSSTFFAFLTDFETI